jgi:hypothetical protein
MIKCAALGTATYVIAYKGHSRLGMLVIVVYHILPYICHALSPAIQYLFLMLITIIMLFNYFILTP